MNALLALVFLCTLFAGPAAAQNRALALARLSFWIPPQRMAEFEAAYEAKVLPILKQHGLVESSERGRATPDSVFSRLFEVKTPSEVEEKQKALRGDPAWKAVLEHLGRAFGSGPSAGPLSYAFVLHSTPAGSGKVVRAGSGKTVPAGRGTGLWRTYDAGDGLVQGIVQSVFQDREGNLWFGTRGGVSRYDGKTFLSFTTKDGLVDNRVNMIFQDREGYLWFGAWSGVSRYDPLQNSRGSGQDGKAFISFTIRDGLANNWVWSIIQDREGNLWFGTNGGVSRYDGRRFATFMTREGLGGDEVRPILQDREGRLWFGTRGGGVSQYDPSTSSGLGAQGSGQAGKTWATFTAQDGLVDNRVTSILQDREGRLWFGTEEGLSRYDPSASSGRRWTTFTSRDGMPSNHVFSMCQDREGCLWVGTIDGLSRYDGETFTIVRESLPDNTILSIFEDQEGHMWFGTWGGVSRYDGKTFVTFTAQDGLAYNVIQSAFEDREGHVWFGTWKGVSRYDGKTFVTFTEQDGLGTSRVRSIFQDREGRLWFGTEGGVSRYDREGRRSSSGVGRSGSGGDRSGGSMEGRTTEEGASGMGTFTTFTTEYGLAHNVVDAILQDRDGNLWFGTVGGGLTRYDGKTFTTFNTFDGLGSNVVVWIFQDREGHLWFGTEGGASRYDGHRFTTLTAQDGLASNRVYAIFQDRDGNLWFGTWGSGVTRYDGKTFTTFTAQDGLADDWVASILQDQEGHLWFSGGGGASRYDGKTFQTVRQQDGLGSGSVRTLLQDREGRLWFGTTKGATRYRRPAPAPPPVVIDGMVADRRYPGKGLISISSNVELVAFHFHGVNFKTRPEQMVYRYRLKGYDRDWKTTHERQVEYQDLARGEYVFEVQAVDRDLVYSEKLASVALRVRLPYEWVGWGSALSIALLLIAWQAGRVVVRDRRLREANAALSAANRELFNVNRLLEASNEDLKEARQQADRANQAKSVFLAHMSHDIRTPMAVILGYAQILKADQTLSPRQRRAMEIVEVSGTHLLSLINDILDLSRIEAGREALNPVDFDLRALAEELSAMFRLRCEQKGLGWRVEVEGGQRPVSGDRHKLSHVLINLLGNAVKFTGAGGVTLRVRAEAGDRYRFEVTDTGPGIPAERQAAMFEPFEQGEAGLLKGGTGLGLTIARRHVTLMGGELGLISEPGRGATFSFTLHLPPARKGVEARLEDRWERVARLSPGLSVEALVVDDIPENREVLAEMLGRIGVGVRTAESGEGALEEVRARPPDIVFMDIRMPGMDGVEAMRRISQACDRARVKIAAISASALTHEQEQYLSAGFDVFLGKPIRAGRLYAGLAHLLGVTYEYADPPQEARPEEAEARAALPEGLAERLRQAAALHRVTELRRCLEEVEALGPQGQGFAARLRALVEGYDMEGILRILKEGRS